MTDDQPKEESLFAIDGPDSLGFVWLRSTTGGGWRRKLGQKDDVLKILYRWLRTVEPDQNEQFWAPLFKRSQERVEGGRRPD